MTWCTVCGCAVPDNAVIAHRRGHRHNGMRYYGERGRRVEDVRLTSASGEVSALRPWEVPDRVVALAREARELVMTSLVAHSGVDLFHRACERFSPELLCSALLSMDERWVSCPTAARALRLDAARGTHVLCAAALVEARAADAAADGLLTPPPLTIEISVEEPTSLLAEVVLSAALARFARSLPRCPPGSRVTVHLDEGLKQRRLVSYFVDSLEVALREASGLQSLSLRVGRGGRPAAAASASAISAISAISASSSSAGGGAAPASASGVLRADDVERLHAASAQSWRARTMPLLLGARVGSGSPLARLTPDVMQAIVHLVAGECRARVAIDQLVEAPSVGPTRQRFAGLDLAHLAQLVS